MAGDRSAEYLRIWFAKAEAEEDVFNRFMSGWLVLAMAATIYRTKSGGFMSEERESQRVIAYLKSEAHSVEKAAQANRPNMEALAKRRGTEGGIVIDGKQQFCRIFRGKILGQSPCSAEKFAEATGEILNRVRNNLFHGAKVYDDSRDRALLELVTPFLLTFLATSKHLR